MKKSDTKGLQPAPKDPGMTRTLQTIENALERFCSNREAEEWLIGSILLNPNQYDEVALIINESHFFDDVCRTIWRICTDVISSNRRLDIGVLTTRLKRERLFEMVGGTAYMAKLAKIVPHSMNAVAYAEMVREMCIGRQTTQVCAQAISMASHSSSTAEEILEHCETGIFEIRNQFTSRPVCVATTLREIERRINNFEEREVVATGFRELDNILLGGFGKGTLNIIAARPGMGKTALALNIAANIGRRSAQAIQRESPEESQRSLYVSLEMNVDELLNRMIAAESTPNMEGHYTLSQILTNSQSNMLQADQLRNLNGHISRLAQYPMEFVDDAGTTIHQIAAHARKLAREPQGLAVVFVDYLQLVVPSNPKDSRQEQVALIARSLKNLAKSLNIPVVALAQLNRESESLNKKPRMSNLRESGEIEQAADTIIFPWMPYKARRDYLTEGVRNRSRNASANSGDAEPLTDDQAREQLASEGFTPTDLEILVEKNRNGAAGIVPKGAVLWRQANVRFENGALNYEQEQAAREASARSYANRRRRDGEGSYEPDNPDDDLPEFDAPAGSYPNHAGTFQPAHDNPNANEMVFVDPIQDDPEPEESGASSSRSSSRNSNSQNSLFDDDGSMNGTGEHPF